VIVEKKREMVFVSLTPDDHFVQLVAANPSQFKTAFDFAEIPKDLNCEN